MNYLGDRNLLGGKLKEADTTHWNSPNTGATNESGFTALPGGVGGLSDQEEKFIGIGQIGMFYGLSSEGTRSFGGTTINITPSFILRSNEQNITIIESTNRLGGLSVRCVKDEL